MNGVLAPLRAILKRATHRDPARRYTHAGEMARDLRAIASLLGVPDVSKIEILGAQDERIFTLLQHTADGDVAAVLTDLDMPELSGAELLNAVKQQSPDTPVIVITAYGTIDSAVEAMKAGAFDYVFKPFDIDELRLIITRSLSAKIHAL